MFPTYGSDTMIKEVEKIVKNSISSQSIQDTEHEDLFETLILYNMSL